MQTPHWFDTYINQPSIKEFITVEGARVSYRTWNQGKNSEKKQSLLFVHSPQKKREKKSRYYQNLETAMLRFRLKPPQKCANQFVLDHIARHSLKKPEQGYSFKVDQGVFAKMEDNVELPSGVLMIQIITCTIGLIYGDRSRFFPKEKHQFLEELMGRGSVVVIPDAAHHVFLDQPQAFIKALAALLLKIQY